MKKVFLFVTLASFNIAFAQNVGIGIPAPVEKLEVNGNTKTNALTISSGGSPYDFLMKNNVNGQVGFKKGHGGVGINYIICLQGSFPSPEGSAEGPFLAEIKLFASNFAPQGWALCNGQLMSINQNPALFSLLGTNYGGNGQTTFALPDLRGAAAVGCGTPAGGLYTWVEGNKSY